MRGIKKTLWIKGPKCCRSIHNLGLALWASTMPASMCPGYCDISCCPKKSPFETKTFVKALHRKGDSHGLCRLLLTFQRKRLTVQKYAMTDVAKPVLSDAYMEIMMR